MTTNSIDRLTQALEQSQRVCERMTASSNRIIDRLERAIKQLEQ